VRGKTSGNRKSAPVRLVSDRLLVGDDGGGGGVGAIVDKPSVNGAMCTAEGAGPPRPSGWDQFLQIC
jgi:hypothetical protein